MQELKHSFNGSFDKMCQENSVPSSLLCLVNMILHGPNIQSQSSKTSAQSALALLSCCSITALCVAVRELLNVNDTTETRKRHFPSTLACLFTQKREASILWIVFMIQDFLFHITGFSPFPRIWATAFVKDLRLNKQFALQVFVKVFSPQLQLTTQIITRAPLPRRTHFMAQGFPSSNTFLISCLERNERLSRLNRQLLAQRQYHSYLSHSLTCLLLSCRRIHLFLRQC